MSGMECGSAARLKRRPRIGLNRGRLVTRKSQPLRVAFENLVARAGAVFVRVGDEVSRDLDLVALGVVRVCVFETYGFSDQRPLSGRDLIPGHRLGGAVGSVIYSTSVSSPSFPLMELPTSWFQAAMPRSFCAGGAAGAAGSAAGAPGAGAACASLMVVCSPARAKAPTKSRSAVATAKDMVRIVSPLSALPCAPMGRTSA